MIWTHEKIGTEKIAMASYVMDPTRKKEKRKTSTYHLDRKHSDYIEGMRN